MNISNNLGREISIFPGKPGPRGRAWLPGLCQTATVRVEEKLWLRSWKSLSMNSGDGHGCTYILHGNHYLSRLPNPTLSVLKLITTPKNNPPLSGKTFLKNIENNTAMVMPVYIYDIAVQAHLSGRLRYREVRWPGPPVWSQSGQAVSPDAQHDLQGQ